MISLRLRTKHALILYIRSIYTFRHAFSQFKKSLSPLHISQKSSTFALVMIQHFLDYIAIERKYSLRSVKAKLSGLRSFYRFLLRQKKVNRDVTARVIPPIKPRQDLE